MWKWDYVVELIPTLLSALRVSLYATVCGFLVAALLGLLLAMGFRSRIAAVRIVVRAFVEFVRSTPLLVQVFSIFYILPSLIPALTLSPFVTGMLGLGIHYSTYLAEVYRSGIDGVPRGQWEAANALNFTKSKTWTQIILPQAVPPILPVMGNYLIVIFKETPILMAVTLGELLFAAKSAASHSFRVFEPYTLVGVLFIVISLLATWLFNYLERRVNRKYSR